MPTARPYPLGEVSPLSLPNAQPSVPTAGEIAPFGGNQAQDLQAAGQRLGQASDSVLSIHERLAREANEIRVQDFNNRFIGGSREMLHTGPDAYYKQAGADAIAGAGPAIERLTELKDQFLGQAPNDDQRQRLRPILDAHLAASVAGIARHAGAQQAVYERGVAATAIETARAEGVADPAGLANAVLRAEGAARVMHRMQPPEVVESEARKAGGSIISAVISDRLSRNDPFGVTLLGQQGDRLDPAERRRLGAAAETLSTTIAATDWLRDRSSRLAAEKTRQAAAPSGDAALDAASAATAEPPPVTSPRSRLLNQDGVLGYRQRLAEIEDRRRALTALNEQEFSGHPARLRANQTVIETDSARSRAAVKAVADKAYADLQAYMTTGGPSGGPAVTLPPATIMSRFADEQQAAVAA